MKKRRWTDEEDKILVQAIKRYPHNLSWAFRKVAKETDRTESAVSYRWYNVTRLKSICFISYSQEEQLVNSKNYVSASGHKGKPNTVKSSLWKKILLLLGLN